MNTPKLQGNYRVKSRVKIKYTPYVHIKLAGFLNICSADKCNKEKPKPWQSVMLQLLLTFNFNCTHFSCQLVYYCMHVMKMAASIIGVHACYEYCQFASSA